MSLGTPKRRGLNLVGGTWGAAWGLVLFSAGAFAQTNPPAPTSPVAGEVTGNDVYVRSGPSSNYYPVSKLNAGDRVTVIGQTGEWYEIVPPSNVFSWISAEYVDTPDNVHGVVNGNNVLIRAGSDLPPFERHRSTLQMKVSRGTEVTILGESADGYLRIRPPSGVSVWISSSLVNLAGHAPPAGSQPTSVDSNAPSSAPSNPPTSTASAPTQRTQRISPSRRATPVIITGTDSALKGLPSTPERLQLVEIERTIQREMEKDADARDFGTISKELRAVADQNDDELAQRYAEARLQQLEEMASLDAAIAQMRKIDEQSEELRLRYIQQRSTMSALTTPTPAGLDAEGVLRESAVFANSATPKRLRLVDVDGDRPRTIAYVEIPPDMTIDLDKYLGHRVGVRSTSSRLQTGTVDPVPVYVVRELVLLDNDDASTQDRG
ncbi:MAG: SH3 domain-containing protein [Phycisphaerae bacterium]|nr:SH3 domain-containing protein [Phycisphaerae bacterium]